MTAPDSGNDGGGTFAEGFKEAWRKPLSSKAFRWAFALGFLIGAAGTLAVLFAK